MNNINVMRRIQKSYAQYIQEYLYSETAFYMASKANEKANENLDKFYERFKDKDYFPKNSKEKMDELLTDGDTICLTPNNPDILDEIDDNKRKWLEEEMKKHRPDAKTRYIDCGMVYTYIRTIRDGETQKEAINGLYSIATENENKLYSNIYNLLMLLYNNELKEENTESPFNDFVQKQLLLKITKHIVSEPESEFDRLKDVKNRDIVAEHCYYAALRDNLRIIPEQGFDKIFQDYYKMIKNPYTKIGMQIMYVYQTLQYMEKNPNYKANKELLNSAIPAIAIEKCFEKDESAFYLAGSFSGVLEGKVKINELNPMVDYCEEFYIDPQPWENLLNKQIDEKYMPFIKFLSEEKDYEAVEYFVQNSEKNFITSQRSKFLDGDTKEMSVEAYIAMIFNKYNLRYNLKDRLNEITLQDKDSKLTSETAFDLETIMLILEDNDQPIDIKKYRDYERFANQLINTCINKGKKTIGFTEDLQKVTNALDTPKQDTLNKGNER